MVTSTPKDFQTEANSTPMTPPPRMMALLGMVVHGQGFVGGDDLAADFQARQGAGVGAGGEDDVLALVGGAVHHDGVGALELAFTFDDGDALGLDQALQALELAGDDAVFVSVDSGDVDAVQGDVHAVLGGVAGVVGQFGGVQQGLGGDTAVVQAGAAQLSLLHEADGEAKLYGPQGSGVSAAAATEYQDVEFLRSCLIGHLDAPSRER